MEHTKRILLVEDLEQFYRPITRWLQQEGYEVTHAVSVNDAKTLFDTEHFHLAIIDVRLNDADDADEGGMLLLEHVRQLDLEGIMPCIILTAYPSVDNVVSSTLNYRVAGYVQKRVGYREDLLEKVATAFETLVKIDFDLAYNGRPDIIVERIARDVRWREDMVKPPLEQLIPQVQDILGHFFEGAESIYINKLPQGLTGAAVIRVRPTWEHGPGPSYVAKIDRREKAKRENRNYDKYVRRYAASGMIEKSDFAETRHLAGILYKFAENRNRPMREFDYFYARNSAETINASLRDLFENTAYYWSNQLRGRYDSVPDQYYEAFYITEAQLIERVRQVFPDYDPAPATIRLRNVPYDLPNPFAWLSTNRDEAVMEVYFGITHGDLTGRNIMVEQDNGKFWLIDFYRTYESHILRDFVILETDLKYRLMPKPDTSDFLMLEQVLLGSRTQDEVDLAPETEKALAVIAELRGMAYRVAQPHGGERERARKQYLISLLMATLNAVRLRHIDDDRKRHAMLSAGLICNRLERMAGRPPLTPL